MAEVLVLKFEHLLYQCEVEKLVVGGEVGVRAKVAELAQDVVFYFGGGVYENHKKGPLDIFNSHTIYRMLN